MSQIYAQRARWKDLVKDAPPQPGVYSLWSGDVLLYVGQALRLDARLPRHNRKYEFLAAEVTHVRWMIIADERQRRETEVYLIRRWRPSLCRDTFIYSAYATS